MRFEQNSINHTIFSPVKKYHAIAEGSILLTRLTCICSLFLPLDNGICLFLSDANSKKPERYCYSLYNGFVLAIVIRIIDSCRYIVVGCML